jgi:hypothetical protein
MNWQTSFPFEVIFIPAEGEQENELCWYKRYKKVKFYVA